MEEILIRFWNDLTGRPSGPLAMRFLLQPAVAAFLATRAGLRDAREGRPPYLDTIFRQKKHRRELLRSGWEDIAKVFFIALALDLIFQVIEFKRIYPLETLVIATVLAIVPYALVRGPVNRIASARRRKETRSDRAA